MAPKSIDKTDKKLAEIYAQKVTVNLDAKSTLSPEDFWSSMSTIALNNRAMINWTR